MDYTRKISKLCENFLFEAYSDGMLTPHIFSLQSRKSGSKIVFSGRNNAIRDDSNKLKDERDASLEAGGENNMNKPIQADVRSFWSKPDSEAILSSMNSFTSNFGLHDFMSQFRQYKYRTDLGDRNIRSALITYPHRDGKINERMPGIPAPHPAMTDEQLLRYIWPTSSLNKDNEDYHGYFWIDIGFQDMDNLEDDDGNPFSIPIENQKWINVTSVPIQVGSNKCNLAIMRSYLGDNTYDEFHQMTWGERAKKFLEETLKWEALLPDGYFIIAGRMKRINVSDKLMMNFPYIVKQSDSTNYGGKKMVPVRERACEVRSVHVEIGVAHIRLILSPPEGFKKNKNEMKGLDSDVYKFYSSFVGMAIKDDFPKPLNVYSVIRGYAVIVLGMNAKDAMDQFDENLRIFSQGDMETLRLATVTRDMAGSMTPNDVTNEFRAIYPPRGDDSMDRPEIDDLKKKMRDSFFPHCEINPSNKNPTQEELKYVFDAKLRFLAMMFIDLVLAVTTKKQSKEYRLEPTDRKDFSYKRWECPGHRFRDYFRSLFIPYGVLNTMEGKVGLGKISTSSEILNFMNQNKWPNNAKSATRRSTRGSDGRMSFSMAKEHKDGIVDDIPEYNLVSMIDSLRTVKISVKEGQNSAAARRIHTSQWGQQCPANTPENANIGFNNNIAEACLVTNELYHYEKNDLQDFINELPLLDQKDGGYLLIIDGNPRGYYAPQAYDQLLEARRDGQINRGIGIARHYLWTEILPPGVPVIVVRTSYGRPIVPVFILDQNKDKYDTIMSLTEDKILEASKRYQNPMEYLIQNGYIEFIDAYEMVHNCVIATWLDTVRMDLVQGKELVYTHAMIKPGHFLSQATNCINFLEHNPAARGTYASTHIKQAIGRPFLYPEERYDHEANYLYNPELPIIKTDTLRRLAFPPKLYQPRDGVQERDIGFGRNVNIACMSFFGNNDDGLFVSEDLWKSGVFDGEHFSITKSDKNSVFNESMYNWLVDPESRKEIKDARGQGIPDINFSDSVVLPYDQSYRVKVPEEEFLNLQPEKIPSLGANSGYELYPGQIYVLSGSEFKLRVKYKYKDTEKFGNEEFERIISPGNEIIDIPDKDIISKEKTEKMYIMSLALLDTDTIQNSMNKSLQRNARPLTIEYDQIQNDYYFDVRFVSKKPIYENWHTMEVVSVPKSLPIGGIDFVTRGVPMGIAPRRAIERGDTAMKKLVRDSEMSDSLFVDNKGITEKFEISFGVVDGVVKGAQTKIRCAMPLQAKVGNKYAALYAQKSVIARIVPTDEMPKAKWYNPILGKEEEMQFDVIFNPLSFPSRGTIGMEYEIFISGMIKYLWDLPVLGLKDKYENDRPVFDQIMYNKYRIVGASDKIDMLLDTTVFLYDNTEKYRICKEMRKQIGIPDEGLYDVYLRDEKTGVWDVKVESPITCGTVFYVALRHLVDNKRRARGYVGKRDPVTGQPVKGRRRNGGANTGTMETDAYKAHGAAGMLYERLSLVSDHRTFLKCPFCNGLVTKSDIGNEIEYRCMECERVLTREEVFEVDSVSSWNLFRNYARGLGIEMYEEYEPVK